LVFAQLLEISTDGVRLRLDRAFQPGTRLILELHRGRYRARLCQEVRVVHVQQQDDWSWVLGCAFALRLMDAEVQKLL
jgi:hypothetical protein